MVTLNIIVLQVLKVQNISFEFFLHDEPDYTVESKVKIYNRTYKIEVELLYSTFDLKLVITETRKWRVVLMPCNWKHFYDSLHTIIVMGVKSYFTQGKKLSRNISCLLHGNQRGKQSKVMKELQEMSTNLPHKFNKNFLPPARSLSSRELGGRWA